MLHTIDNNLKDQHQQLLGSVTVLLPGFKKKKKKRNKKKTWRKSSPGSQFLNSKQSVKKHVLKPPISTLSNGKLAFWMFLLLNSFQPLCANGSLQFTGGVVTEVDILTVNHD